MALKVSATPCPLREDGTKKSTVPETFEPASSDWIVGIWSRTVMALGVETDRARLLVSPCPVLESVKVTLLSSPATRWDVVEVKLSTAGLRRPTGTVTAWVIWSDVLLLVYMIDIGMS